MEMSTARTNNNDDASDTAVFESAVEFLIHPTTSQYDESAKLEFLKSKGLSDADISRALAAARALESQSSLLNENASTSTSSAFSALTVAGFFALAGGALALTWNQYARPLLRDLLLTSEEDDMVESLRAEIRELRAAMSAQNASLESIMASSPAENNDELRELRNELAALNVSIASLTASETGGLVSPPVTPLPAWQRDMLSTPLSAASSVPPWERQDDE